MKECNEGKVRKAFSEASARYDDLTRLHKDIGQRLIWEIDCQKSYPVILDIGMGTGCLTTRLVKRFPDGMVIGMDFADGMVERASRQMCDKDFHIVQANAIALPFRADSFDVISSNLVYQWVEDLPRAFEVCEGCLKRGGSLHLTLFGQDMFMEVFQALEATRSTTGICGPLLIQRLPDWQVVARAIAEAGLELVTIRREYMKICFKDMMEMLKWSKAIGANRLAKDIYVGKDWLARANDYYCKEFRDCSGVYATFEVIWVEAKKASQL